jgi:hypothetical protein
MTAGLGTCSTAPAQSLAGPVMTEPAMTNLLMPPSGTLVKYQEFVPALFGQQSNSPLAK